MSAKNCFRSAEEFASTSLMDQHQIETELEFKAVRSSGPGGQHANKTSTKVELSFHVENSNGLSEAEKGRIQRKLENRINREGFLKMSSEDSRSQHSNREIVIHNFLELIKSALKKQLHFLSKTLKKELF